MSQNKSTTIPGQALNVDYRETLYRGMQGCLPFTRTDNDEESKSFPDGLGSLFVSDAQFRTRDPKEWSEDLESCHGYLQALREQITKRSTASDLGELYLSAYEDDLKAQEAGEPNLSRECQTCKTVLPAQINHTSQVRDNFREMFTLGTVTQEFIDKAFDERRRDPSDPEYDPQEESYVTKTSVKELWKALDEVGETCAHQVKGFDQPTWESFRSDIEDTIKTGKLDTAR